MINHVLTSANAALVVTNFAPTPVGTTLGGVPLGTVGGTATGELGMKVILVGGASAALGTVGITTFKGAANIAVAQITATGTAATLVVARATRRSVLFRNTHATASCWIGPATVTAANGFKLGPGESCPFTWVGLLQIIDDGATHPVVHIADEYD